MRANLYLRLFQTEFKRLFKDSFLIFMLIYPLAFSCLTKKLVLSLDSFWALHQVSIENFYPLISSFFTILLCFSVGIIVGFQILEEKDLNLLQAIAVTPYQLKRHIFYKLSLYALVTFPIMIGVQYALNLTSLLGLHLFLVFLMSSLLAPIIGFIYLIFARNQVQAFAVLKASGFLISLPVISFFIQKPFAWIFSVLPTFWPLKAFWVAASGNNKLFYFCFFIGFFYEVLLIFILFKQVFKSKKRGYFFSKE